MTTITDICDDCVMKKIVAILLAVLIIGTVCVLAGCGEKEVSAAEKQKEYETLFEDASKIKMNSTNVSAVGIKDGKKMLEIQSKESGDFKMSMYLTENVGYTDYQLGSSAYLEMHIPEYKDGDGNIVKAEDLYYKRQIGGDRTDNTLIPNIAESLELTNKENIVSVKYIETKEINGVKCDVIKVSHMLHNESEEVVDDVESQLEDSNDSKDENATENPGVEVEIVEIDNTTPTDDEDDSSNDKNSEEQEQILKVTSTFYFVSDTKKLYGYKATTNELELACLFVDDLTIELPKGVEFIEADEETINDKMTSLYSASYYLVYS